MKTSTDDRKYLSRWLKLFGRAAIGVAALWFLVGLLPVAVFPGSATSFNAAGTFGDSFGVVNSLFSALAFAGVIVTMILQTEELKLQRRELDETQEELRRSAQAQEASERMFTLTAHLNGLNVLRQGFAGIDSEFSRAWQQRIMGELMDVTGRARTTLQGSGLAGSDADFTREYLETYARFVYGQWEAEFKGQKSPGVLVDLLQRFADEIDVAISSLSNPVDPKGPHYALMKVVKEIRDEAVHVSKQHNAVMVNRTTENKQQALHDEFWIPGRTVIMKLLRINVPENV